jgi:hypothetical protein
MSREIDAVMVEFFDSEVKRAYQDSRVLGDTVYTKTNVEGKTAYFNKKAKGLATRHNPGADVTAMNTDFSRVSCTLEDWEAFDYADKFDAKKINFEEVTELAEVASDAIGLRMDQIIIDAIEDGYDSVNNAVGTATTDLTVATLLSGKKILDENGVPMKERNFIHNAKQLEDLLGTTEVTSSDYNSVKALVNGEVDTFLGFKFILIAERTEGGLPTTGSGSTEGVIGFIYHKRAIGQAIGMNMETEMAWVPEKRSYLVGAEFSSGAVVIDDEGIVGVTSANN